MVRITDLQSVDREFDSPWVYQSITTSFFGIRIVGRPVVSSRTRLVHLVSFPFPANDLRTMTLKV